MLALPPSREVLFKAMHWSLTSHQSPTPLKALGPDMAMKSCRVHEPALDTCAGQHGQAFSTVDYY
jgi:hypothetical protein